MLLKKPSCIIIGIHGLNNKVSKRLLIKWWKASIQEGLKNAGYPPQAFKFEMSYWARRVYAKPLNPREKREGHPLFLSRPYVPSSEIAGESTSQEIKPSLWGRLFRRTVNRVLISHDNEDEPEGERLPVLEQSFPDLGLYYANKRVFSHRYGLRDLLRRDLAKMIRKHSGSRIMLIGHSMGSIIAFDVLGMYKIQIDVFATMGSPLGFPTIKKKYAREHNLNLTKDPLIPTPNTIQSKWINFADIEDIIAYFSPLSDHYRANRHGVTVEDRMMSNDYTYKGNPHHHTVFGYLRSTETADLIASFLKLRKTEQTDTQNDEH